MTTRETVQWVLTTVQFVTVILAGVFILEIASVWLRNKREERANTVREAEQRMSARYDQERTSWLAILSEKDRELASMTDMMAKLQKNYDIATRILNVAEIRKGEEA